MCRFRSIHFTTFIGSTFRRRLKCSLTKLPYLQLLLLISASIAGQGTLELQFSEVTKRPYSQSAMAEAKPFLKSSVISIASLEDINHEDLEGNARVKPIRKRCASIIDLRGALLLASLLSNILLFITILSRIQSCSRVRASNAPDVSLCKIDQLAVLFETIFISQQ